MLTGLVREGATQTVVAVDAHLESVIRLRNGLEAPTLLGAGSRFPGVALNRRVVVVDLTILRPCHTDECRWRQGW